MRGYVALSLQPRRVFLILVLFYRYLKHNTSSIADGTSSSGGADGTSSGAYTTEEYLKITEEQLKAAASQQQIQTNALG